MPHVSIQCVYIYISYISYISIYITYSHTVQWYSNNLSNSVVLVISACRSPTWRRSWRCHGLAVRSKGRDVSLVVIGVCHCLSLFVPWRLRNSLVHVVIFKCFPDFLCKRLLVSCCYEILACVAHRDNGTPAKIRCYSSTKMDRGDRRDRRIP